MSNNKYAAISSFVQGIGSMLDLGSIQLNKTIKKIGYRSDVEALSSDWKIIEQDFNVVLNNYSKNFKK